ncbi:glycosyltransferase [Shewanella sp. NKUCC01_JLK]|uniref:glycosyltransferase n=1 Tax=Shewanella sp. NKUCC01_JLK TaxID=2842123 RepID=UPI001C5A8883|nr:glycosyltransferase [Shewanella sp. NKUCC01_JLK]MBW3514111.1 glycosyltransferase [Shewanella sp. NKUCC01_JLK]
MRVLFLFNSLSVSGVSKANLILANEFSRRGYDVEVLTYLNADVSALQADNINFHCFGYKKYGFPELLISFFKLFFYFKINKRFDLVISSSDLISLPVALVKFFYEYKLIINSHTNIIEHLKGKNIFVKGLYSFSAFVIKNMAKVTNVSYDAAVASKKFYKIDDVTVLPNPISPWILNKNIKYVHPWFDNYKVIVACGRLTKSKNYDLMLRSFKLLTAKRNDVKLLIIGDGEERAYLERLALQLQVLDSVHFTGNVKEPRVYMQHATFFYHTSLYEGAPMVLIEALSTDIPIVTTRFKSGAEEILENGKYGILIDSFDLGDCISALNDGLNLSPHEKGYYSNKAKDFIPSVIADKYIETYLQC